MRLLPLLGPQLLCASFKGLATRFHEPGREKEGNRESESQPALQLEETTSFPWIKHNSTMVGCKRYLHSSKQKDFKVSKRIEYFFIE
jgi:hypothetical protein